MTRRHCLLILDAIVFFYNKIKIEKSREKQLYEILLTGILLKNKNATNE